MDVFQQALDLHKQLVGKIEVVTKSDIKSPEALSLLYSPGVAAPCLEIEKNPDAAYDYTSKGNMVAIVTDGTAVLGLGDIGPTAALPVMEGKAALFKAFADVDAIPICVASKEIDDIVKTVELISPSLGGVNLEDISAPKCFEIERRLKEKLDIPVFHDDQHGTAIVTLAALENALKLVDKKIEDITIVVSGVGAAGTAIIKLLYTFGARNFCLCGRNGMIYQGSLEEAQPDIDAYILNQKNTHDKAPLATLAEAMVDADLFVGVSVAGTVTKDMVRSMNKDPLIFALANPTPEIMPEDALEAGARVVATGRTDYPNQINNVLAFPGIFRGALDARASDINEDMKIAAVRAISGIIKPSEITETNIIPSVFDDRVVTAVSAAVRQAAIDSGVARK